MSIDGLCIAEFEDIAPVQHFRDAFIAGWHAVRDAVEAEREAVLAGATAQTWPIPKPLDWPSVRHTRIGGES